MEKKKKCTGGKQKGYAEQPFGNPLQSSRKDNRNDDRVGGGRESQVMKRQNGENVVTDWQRGKRRNQEGLHGHLHGGWCSLLKWETWQESLRRRVVS